MNCNNKLGINPWSGRARCWTLGVVLCSAIGCGGSDDDSSQKQDPASSMPEASGSPTADGAGAGAQTPPQGAGGQTGDSPAAMPDATQPIAGPGLPMDPPAERAQLTRQECTDQGGQVVGDIGDGAIHRADYRCANGQPPLGSIMPLPGEPIAFEGEVCCGK